MIPEAHIAVAWGSPGGATAEISDAIENLVGKRPKLIRLSDLAGPNETIQILLSTEDWILLAKAVIAIYGAELVKEAAKATWRAAAPKLSQATVATTSYLDSLVRAIRQALHAKAPVIFGYPRTPIGGRRYIGVEITDASPEEIYRIISLLAAKGEEVNHKLDEWDRIRAGVQSILYKENSDASVKIAVTDEGSMQLQATVIGPTPTSKEIILYELCK